MANTHDSTKTMSQEMQNIMDHANALVDATSGELDDRIKTARAALKERLTSVKGDYGQIEAQLLDKVQAADEFIHVKPYYAIGTTFVAGLLLGWFMSRK
ncbi:MAG: DUF883 family protein [Proteobacteria bacterium]|nr:DUF883 family protein [Desulfocapsa sp.]MBU3943947.1 DUF883 family protein [Pseudomonadota bacterium]MCG2744962.1 hypothetical protein [Desulfobacteraceae bacterium]MBU4027956.1 DUF883 family protein [Pseudomonadota bacterium]MBU4042442.1 DUF883 family protein [Pseudomonadota bacterium]